MVRALVAEDEVLVRELIADNLADAGFAVTEAGSGEEAWAILERDPGFALLVTDVRMPGAFDGWELGRRARALGIPVIYTTGASEADVALGARERRLGKPYRYDELIALVAELGVHGSGG